MISPEIMTLGPMHLRWYGVCAAVGMAVAYLLMVCRARKYSMKSSDCVDIVCVGIVAGLIGARLEYVRREWTQLFQDNPLDIVKIWEGGLSFQGGLLLAAAVLVIFCFIRHWKVANVADLVAPALAAGHLFGRLGCFLNGCCYGRVYSGWGAVHYPALADSVLPIQLVEAAFCLILTLVLLLIEKRNRMPGCLFPLYLVLYSIGRFFIEYGRGDYLDKGATFTPAQSLFLFAVLPVGALLLVWRALQKSKGVGSEKNVKDKRKAHK